MRLQRFDLILWPEVVSLWVAQNRLFAHAIEHCDPAALTHIWLYEGQRLALGFILVDYVGHIDHHLHQFPGYPRAA